MRLKIKEVQETYGSDAAVIAAAMAIIDRRLRARRTDVAVKDPATPWT